MSRVALKSAGGLPSASWKQNIYTHPTHFDPEDGGRRYLRNICNTAHMHTVQRPKSKIKINNEPG
jgi:hypothetical protein